MMDAIVFATKVLIIFFLSVPILYVYSRIILRAYFVSRRESEDGKV
jgi:hypothetical protein